MADTNINAGGDMVPVRLSGTPREDKYARARARGWNDVRKGRGFRDDYDSWKRLVQFAYERGRMQAILAQTAQAQAAFPKLPKGLPVWNRDRHFFEVLAEAVGAVKAREIDEITRVVRKRKETKS